MDKLPELYVELWRQWALAYLMLLATSRELG